MLWSKDAYSFAPNNGGWSPIWDEGPAQAMGSVNAGDPALYVGGGGVNAAFAKTLAHPKSYTALHQAAINLAADHLMPESKLETVELHQVQQPSQYSASVEKCYVRLVPELAQRDDYTTGAVIIDVFQKASRPLHPNNKAMIYVVGPQGRGRTKESFLAAVELTARNIILALNAYNCMTPEDPLLVVRLCLLSGGIFKHKQTTKDDVARALVQGIIHQWKQGVTPRIDFAWDQNAFQNAIDTMIKNDSSP